MNEQLEEEINEYKRADTVRRLPNSTRWPFVMD